MGPSSNKERDALDYRLESMERRQDDRHKENTEALRDIGRKLEPLVSDMKTLCGNEQHPGRMGLAEESIKEHGDQLDGLKGTVQKWSGVIAFLIFALGIGVPLVEHFWK